MSEELVIKTRKAKTKGSKLRHMAGDEPALDLIRTMIVMNATHYEFEAEMVDKKEESLGTYKIEITRLSGDKELFNA